ncbi:MAG: PEP-CTERM sorting domain-containing protein [Fimbriimonadaceae bacterium]|jgi:hypothetical protein|nr:PEP-CTERM sorting domain-containing protein [Fimbriimonadaceae bacterium]
MTQLQRTFLVAAAALGMVLPSTAQLIAYEGFDYNSGLDLAGLSGGTGWTNNWSFSTSPTATVKTQANSVLTGGAFTGGSAFASSGRLSNFSREFTPSTGRVWASIAIRFTEILNNSVLEFNLSPAGQNGGATKAEIRTNGSGVTTLQTFHDFPGAGVTSSFTPVIGQVYTFVMTYNTGGAAPTGIYVNPVYGASDPSGATHSAVFTGGNWGAANLGRFRAFYDRVAFDIDEIRIGNTYQDVTPVPEPMTMSLLALGAAAVAARRKRKQTR